MSDRSSGWRAPRGRFTLFLPLTNFHNFQKLKTVNLHRLDQFSHSISITTPSPLLLDPSVDHTISKLEHPLDHDYIALTVTSSANTNWSDLNFSRTFSFQFTPVPLFRIVIVIEWLLLLHTRPAPSPLWLRLNKLPRRPPPSQLYEANPFPLFKFQPMQSNIFQLQRLNEFLGLVLRRL